jgi:hypothetical protein
MELNGYELSRKWFDFCFENPEKIKPNHTALYFFAIEHCNRLGWKPKFGFPTEMAKDAIGIKNYRTYINTLNDLIDWGFITMVEKSRNQWSANIIALVKNTKTTTKALDKAMQKHDTKQCKSKVESIDSINKPITNKPITIDFDIFWNLYDYKKDRKKAKLKWDKLKLDTQQKIIDSIPEYKKSTSDKQFRKHPSTYLNNESWNDEITIKKSIEDQYKVHYKENESNTAANDYAFLLKQKKDVLYKFDDIITIDEFSKLNINGSLETVIITFQNYGKSKDEFLTNLGIHVRKY